MRIGVRSAVKKKLAKCTTPKGASGPSVRAPRPKVPSGTAPLLLRCGPYGAPQRRGAAAAKAAQRRRESILWRQDPYAAALDDILVILRADLQTERRDRQRAAAARPRGVAAKVAELAAAWRALLELPGQLRDAAREALGNHPRGPQIIVAALKLSILLSIFRALARELGAQLVESLRFGAQLWLRRPRPLPAKASAEEAIEWFLVELLEGVLRLLWLTAMLQLLLVAAALLREIADAASSGWVRVVLFLLFGVYSLANPPPEGSRRPPAGPVSFGPRKARWRSRGGLRAPSFPPPP